MDNPIIEVMAHTIPYKMPVVYLTTLPTLRAYIYIYIYYTHSICKIISDSFSVFISDQNVNGKSKRNCIMAKAKETVFFHFLGNPRVTYLIISFVLKISIIISSRQTDTKYQLVC